MNAWSSQRFWCACALVWMAWIPPLLRSAAAQGTHDIKVEVIEVAGRRAYVTPGEDEHLRRGDTVAIGSHRYKVLAASATSALIDTSGDVLRVGQRGRSTVTVQESEEVARLAAPQPLSSYYGQWRKPTLPATLQTPKHVPLGQPTQRDDSTRVMLSASGVGQIPLSAAANPIARGMLRARLQTTPFQAVPLTFDIDGAAQMWIARDVAQRVGSASQPPARVYALMARYGYDDGFTAGLGRLRYAASGLGSLDGLRLEAPIAGPLRLAAFGGFMPGPLNGAPDLNTSRFGAEATFEDEEADLRPRLSLTAYGSRFHGQLDERRIFLQADAYPGDSYGGVYTQVSFYDFDNPWNAPATELTAAGAHGGTRLGVFHLGGRLDMQRPERSLWLASYLPPEWLCIPKPQPPTTSPEQCYGHEVRLMGQANMGLSFDDVSVDWGATASRTQYTNSSQNGGFLSLRLLRIFEQARAQITLSGSRGSLLRTAAVSVAPGVAIGDSMDASVRYQPSISQYTADTGYFIQHAVGGSLLYLPVPQLSFSLDTDAITSRDVKLLLVQLTSTWRN